uniref:Peroxisomal biogenesis factor 19 n=1 Tax=Macrostomum lignano TaxID=282301 RepID=A0A1I8FGR4_9PLAT
MMKEFADSAEAAGPPGPPKAVGHNESVRTEDLRNKFSQLMQPEGSTARQQKARPGVGGDAESIRTEDFCQGVRKTLVPPAGESESAISVAILVIHILGSLYYFAFSSPQN